MCDFVCFFFFFSVCHLFLLLVRRADDQVGQVGASQMHFTIDRVASELNGTLSGYLRVEKLGFGIVQHLPEQFLPNKEVKTNTFNSSTNIVAQCEVFLAVLERRVCRDQQHQLVVGIWRQLCVDNRLVAASRQVQR